MTVQMNVYGIDVALKELRHYDREMYIQLSRGMLAGAKPLALVVGAEFPQAALRNWVGDGRTAAPSRFPRDYGYAVISVKPKLPKTSRKSTAGKGMVTRQILRIEASNEGAAIFEQAGRHSNHIFVRNLDAKFGGRSSGGGTRSRVMFKAVKNNQPLVEHAVATVVALTDKIVTQNIIMNAGK